MSSLPWHRFVRSPGDLRRVGFSNCCWCQLGSGTCSGAEVRQSSAAGWGGLLHACWGSLLLGRAEKSISPPNPLDFGILGLPFLQEWLGGSW